MDRKDKEDKDKLSYEQQAWPQELPFEDPLDSPEEQPNSEQPTNFAMSFTQDFSVFRITDYNHQTNSILREFLKDINIDKIIENLKALRSHDRATGDNNQLNRYIDQQSQSLYSRRELVLTNEHIVNLRNKATKFWILKIYRKVDKQYESCRKKHQRRMKRQEQFIFYVIVRAMHVFQRLFPDVNAHQAEYRKCKERVMMVQQKLLKVRNGVNIN
jgi:hypothetical protein